MKQFFQYILFFKPYGVVSQFTREGELKSLRDFGPFPPSVYPVGRLDADSEGLLLLTDDNEIKNVLTDPKFGHPRTYLVQVEGIPDDNDLQQLRQGVLLSGTRTKPAEVRTPAEEPSFPARSVPIRYRRNIPTSWVEITLREGRNRQVRKMTAAVGHPTLRLIRTIIGPLSLESLGPGELRALRAEEVFDLKNYLGVKNTTSQK